MGKSIGAGSLSIWTNKFKSFQFFANYSDPSTTYTGPAARIGSGWLTVDLYKELDKLGYVLVAGECAVSL